ncbi:MAG: hypothetical protein LBI63_05410 [Candidatus Ancillula sp.]|nr:hypothetical protein [Candidatus Ancillula sp.]
MKGKHFGILAVVVMLVVVFGVTFAVVGFKKPDETAQNAIQSADKGIEADHKDTKQGDTSPKQPEILPEDYKPSTGTGSTPNSKKTTAIVVTNNGSTASSIYAAAALPSSEIAKNGSCEWLLYNGDKMIINTVIDAVNDTRNATCPSPEFPVESIRAKGVTGNVELHLLLKYESDISTGSATTSTFQVKL